MNKFKKFETLFTFFSILTIYLFFLYKIGFDILPINDGWLLERFVNNKLNIPTFRIIGFIIRSFGYYIDPNGFLGTNLLLLLFNTLRSFLVYLIFRKIFNNFYVSFFIAIIYSVYPAEHGYFWMGSLGVQVATTLFLLAVYLFLYFPVKNNPNTKEGLYKYVFIMPLTLSFLTHPGHSFLAIFLTLIFIIKRKNHQEIFSWLAISLIFFSSLVYRTLFKNEYEAKVKNFNIELTLDKLNDLFINYYEIIKLNEFVFLIFSIITVLVIFNFVFNKDKQYNVSEFAILLIFILITLFSFLPYALADIGANNFRKYFLANIGIVSFIVYVIYLASNIKIINKTIWRNFLTVFLMFIFSIFFIECSNNLSKFHEKAEYQKKVLSQIYSFNHNLKYKLIILEPENHHVYLKIKGIVNRPKYAFEYFFGDNFGEVVNFYSINKKFKEINGCLYTVNKCYDFSDIYIYRIDNDLNVFALDNINHIEKYHKIDFFYKNKNSRINYTVNKYKFTNKRIERYLSH